MRTLAWDRNRVIREVRDRIWTHLSPTLARQALALDASRLLQMAEVDLQALARVQFMTSNQVGDFLLTLPFLVRRLNTTTAYDQERSVERVRGAIDWPPTITGRLATGQPHLYVTRPARRAFQTPENALLAFTLQQVTAEGQKIGWRSSKGAGQQVGVRTTMAERWRSHRAIQEIAPIQISSRDLARIAHGRNGRRYASVVDAYLLWRQLIEQLDARQLRTLIEQAALVTTEASVLFEIRCAFETLDSLRSLDWGGDKLHAFMGGLTQVLHRARETLTIWYQHVPAQLANQSRYRSLQQAHGVPVGSLRPDLILRRDTSTGSTWLLVECKLGETRTVEQSARAALVDLLAYRRVFDTPLAGQHPYGLGIAWGAELEPNPAAEIMLCSQDQIGRAIHAFAA